MLERDITNKIQKWLKMQGDCKGYKNHGNTFQVSGRPDLEGNCGPFAFYFEVKRPGGKTTKRQDAELEQIKRSGCLAVAVVTSLEEVKNYITSLRVAKRRIDAALNGVWPSMEAPA